MTRETKAFNIPGIEEYDVAGEARAEAERVTEEARAAITKELSGKIAAVSSSLTGVSNAKQMPLSIFKEFFLPMFARSVNDKNTPAFDVEETNRRLGAWLAHAGSYYAEVPVIDESGKVVFRVPPLLNADVSSAAVTNGIREGTPGLHVLSAHCEALKNAGRVNEALETEAIELEKKMPSERATALFAVVNFLRWNDICAFCGIPPFYPKVAQKVNELDGVDPLTSTPVDNPHVDKIEVSTDGAEADELF